MPNILFFVPAATVRPGVQQVDYKGGFGKEIVAPEEEETDERRAEEANRSNGPRCPQGPPHLANRSLSPARSCVGGRRPYPGAAETWPARARWPPRQDCRVRATAGLMVWRLYHTRVCRTPLKAPPPCTAFGTRGRGF